MVSASSGGTNPRKVRRVNIELFAAALLPLALAAIFFLFWRSLKKRQVAEEARLARIRQLREQEAQRAIDNVRKAAEWNKTHAAKKVAPRPQPTVVTPRKAAVAPTTTKVVEIRRSYTPTPSPAPAAPQPDTFGDAMLGSAIGTVLGNLISHGNDDRPSHSCSRTDDTPFSSGGGGDYGGGGAESSWDSGSSSSDSSSSSSYDSGSSSSSFD